MQLLIIVATVAVMAIAESAPIEPVSNGPIRLAVALGGVVIVALVGLTIASWTAEQVRRDFQRRHHYARRFGWFATVHGLFGLAVSLLIVQGLGWTQLVRFNWQLGHTFLADELLILLPVVLPQLLSWAAYYEVERALELPGDSPVGGRAAYLVFHFRHQMGLLLLPVLLVLAVDDALRIAVPQVADDQRAWMVGMPLVALLAVGFPLVLRRVWRTETLPAGALRALLERRAAQWRIATRDILIWHTGGRIVNAAVTGFLPPLRYVLLTDALLARFEPGEVEAIFAHEAAHMRRRHLLVRLCALALPVILVFALLRAFPAAAESFRVRLADWQLPRSWQQAAVLPALLGLYAIGPFARLARLLEMEADLLACESLAQPVEGAASSGENGLREPVGRMVTVLEKMAALAGIPRDRTTWLHPSMARRVEHLQTAANDAAYANRFLRRMHALGRVLWLGCGLSLVLLFALA